MGSWFYSTFVKTSLSLPGFHHKFVSLDKEVPKNQGETLHYSTIGRRQVFAVFFHFTSMHSQLHVNRFSNHCLKW